MAMGGSKKGKASLAENTEFEPPNNDKTISNDVMEQLIQYAIDLSVEVAEWKLNKNKIRRVLDINLAQLAKLNSVAMGDSKEK